MLVKLVATSVDHLPKLGRSIYRIVFDVNWTQALLNNPNFQIGSFNFDNQNFVFSKESSTGWTKLKWRKKIVCIQIAKITPQVLWKVRCLGKKFLSKNNGPRLTSPWSPLCDLQMEHFIFRNEQDVSSFGRQHDATPLLKPETGYERLQYSRITRVDNVY